MSSLFRTVDLSDPRFELEGLRMMTVKSRALRQRADLTLFVPPQARDRRDVPLVILLHGVYGSHTGWAFKGGAHRVAQRLIDSGEISPMVLAMPSDGLWGDGSAYTRHPDQDFEAWIVDEAPGAAREAEPCVSAESPLFISGLSMGGFGALRLAAKHPGKFRAGGGHSSITCFEELAAFVEEPLATYSCPEDDRSILSAILANRDRLPALRFDCGTEDPLIEPNRTLHRDLVEAGIPHEYKEFPGAHNWPYWEAHLPDMLRFFHRISEGAGPRC
jgi:S-formylglutathione hydrolase FrmB